LCNFFIFIEFIVGLMKCSRSFQDHIMHVLALKISSSLLSGGNCCWVHEYCWLNSLHRSFQAKFMVGRALLIDCEQVGYVCWDFVGEMDSSLLNVVELLSHISPPWGKNVWLKAPQTYTC
jgi:hypothetical protein